MKVRSRIYVFGLVFALAPFPIWSQTTVLQEQLNSEYKTKTLLLRKFYTANNLTYDENGQFATPSIQGSWTVAHLRLKHIGFTPSGIEIVGDRMGVIYSSGKQNFIKIAGLKIQVPRRASGSESETEVRRLFDNLFLTPGEDVRPLLPDYWKPYFEGNDSKSRLAAWRTSVEKNNSSSSPLVSSAAENVSPPQAVFLPDPKYSDEARSHGVEGSCKIVLVVNATGLPDNVAIIGPIGFGLDEEAIRAVRQWRFRPGMKDGQPIRVQINVDVSFRGYP